MKIVSIHAPYVACTLHNGSVACSSPWFTCQALQTDTRYITDINRLISMDACWRCGNIRSHLFHWIDNQLLVYISKVSDSKACYLNINEMYFTWQEKHRLLCLYAIMFTNTVYKFYVTNFMSHSEHWAFTFW